MIHPFESKKATKQYDSDKKFLIKQAKGSSHEKALGNVLKGKNIEGKPSKGNFKKDPRKAPKSERMKNGLDNYYV